MNHFFKTALISSLIGLFIVLGCGNPTGSQPTVSVIGTWKGTVSDSTMSMVVANDSAFETIVPNKYGDYDVTGKYTLKGNTITLNYASGLQAGEGIPPPSINPASGTISGNKMTIPIPYDQTGASVTLTKQ